MLLVYNINAIVSTSSHISAGGTNFLFETVTYKLEMIILPLVTVTTISFLIELGLILTENPAVLLGLFCQGDHGFSIGKWWQGGWGSNVLQVISQLCDQRVLILWIGTWTRTAGFRTCDGPYETYCPPVVKETCWTSDIGAFVQDVVCDPATVSSSIYSLQHISDSHRGCWTPYRSTTTSNSNVWTVISSLQLMYPPMYSDYHPRNDRDIGGKARIHPWPDYGERINKSPLYSMIAISRFAVEGQTGTEKLGEVCLIKIL